MREATARSVCLWQDRDVSDIHCSNPNNGAADVADAFHSARRRGPAGRGGSIQWPARHIRSAREIAAQSVNPGFLLPHSVSEDDTIGGVPVAYQEVRCFIPWERLDDLSGNPLGCWMIGCRNVNEAPTSVLEHDEPLEQLEPECRNNEQVDCRNAVGVVSRELFPRLRRWPLPPCHVFRDGQLRYVGPQLQGFAARPKADWSC